MSTTGQARIGMNSVSSTSHVCISFYTPAKQQPGHGIVHSRKPLIRFRCRDLASRSPLGHCRVKKNAQRHICLVSASRTFTASNSKIDVDELLQWLIERKGLPPQRADCTGMSSDGTLSLFSNTDVQADEALLEMPGDISVTAVDVAAHSDVAALAQGRGELTGLALWLLAERKKGEASEWAPFLRCLPQRTRSPVLWPDALRCELLRGSPTLKEAQQRAQALRQEWDSIAAVAAADPQTYPAETYNFDSFQEAMSVVLAHAAYLPSASCFALLPIISQMRRTGDETGALLDYHLQKQCVTVAASKGYRQGEEIAIFDGRPNGELVLATGQLEDDNPADCLTVKVGLVQADRMYMPKKQILESLGYEAVQEFPMFRDRMPAQLLSYLRLARLTDSALLAKVSFEQDVILSPANEYEVLQLLLGECRERLSAYAGAAEEEVKILQQPELSEEERLAARLRLSEKRILQGTMDAVRRRLAPIRGIPTKSGDLADPNADLREVFDTIEALPSLPSKLVDGFMSWARGEQDPDWKKKQQPPPRK